MRILVTGYNGQLGYDIVNILQVDHKVDGIDIGDLDITLKEDVQKFFRKNEYDIIIHCAAYTNVEKAEEDKINCHLVNVEGTRNLVERAKKQEALFIYFSTDYVFDGNLDIDAEYDEHHKTNPISVYGSSKQLGKDLGRSLDKYYILRISWVYGVNGNNFAKTMLRLSETRTSLTVISDQIGSPTYTYDVASNIEQFFLSEKFGTYNFTNTGFTSWAEYARKIFEIMGRETYVLDFQTKDYPTKAKRPLNSKLSQKKLSRNGFKALPKWDDAILRYLKELGEL